MAQFWDTNSPYHYARVEERPNYDVLIVGGGVSLLTIYCRSKVSAACKQACCKSMQCPIAEQRSYVCVWQSDSLFCFCFDVQSLRTDIIL